jgi:hypothetical protein
MSAGGLVALSVAPGCDPGGDDDDTVGDGDADADADGDGDGDVECEPVEEGLPTCVPDGLDAAPARVEEGCGGLGVHTVRLDVLIKDTDGRIHQDIARPFLSMSVSGRDPLTFPVSASLQALVNGCEIPASETLDYNWTFEDEEMTIVLQGGKHYVFEVRERGEGGEGGARLFWRKDLLMPAVFPNIQTPATDEVLPPDARNVDVTVTWDPFDLEEATWATTKSLTMQAFVQGGGAFQLFADPPEPLSGIDGMNGEVLFASGLFEEWDFIRMRADLFSPSQQESISISVVRSVN